MTVVSKMTLAVFIPDALSMWSNLGKYFEVLLITRLRYKHGRKTHNASPEELTCVGRLFSAHEKSICQNTVSCAHL